MFSSTDFENLVWDFMFTYRQFLLHGNLHQEIDKDIYEKNPQTWNTILLSLDSGSVLGLARLLEREKDLGRKFNDKELDDISERIIKIRKSHVAHADLSTLRNSESFLDKNKLSGTEGIRMIDAIKNRLIQYQNKFGFNIDVETLFRQTTKNAMGDLNTWLALIKSSKP